MNKWIIPFLLAILVIIGVFFWLKPQFFQPNEVRAAIDIGSGTTNLKVAKVNPKTNKIISIIFEKTVPVAYQKQLEQSPTYEFNKEIMAEGIASLQSLKDLALQHQAKKVVAIATAAFRAAANGPEFAKEIQNQTGVEVRIIDQDEEGILAFRGAIALSPIKPENAVVWDIGGGSMQFTSLSDQGTYLIEHGKLASVPFKNVIIQQIEGKDLATVASPNPIDTATMDSAIDYATQQALLTDQYLKDKILQPDTQVLAVGNLFNLGIHPLITKDPVVGQKTMNQNELMGALDNLKGRSDAQLLDFTIPEVTVSNPLLVMGYMKGLNIQQVEFVRVNNADGALTYAAYWE